MISEAKFSPKRTLAGRHFHLLAKKNKRKKMWSRRDVSEFMASILIIVDVICQNVCRRKLICISKAPSFIYYLFLWTWGQEVKYWLNTPTLQMLAMNCSSWQALNTQINEKSSDPSEPNCCSPIILMLLVARLIQIVQKLILKSKARMPNFTSIPQNKLIMQKFMFWALTLI